MRRIIDRDAAGLAEIEPSGDVALRIDNLMCVTVHAEIRRGRRLADRIDSGLVSRAHVTTLVHFASERRERLGHLTKLCALVRRRLAAEHLFAALSACGVAAAARVAEIGRATCRERV